MNNNLDKISELINMTWNIYSHKAANKLLSPKNEKMMQLQLAFLLQTLCPLFEFNKNESIKVLLEEPAIINKGKREIDIVISHLSGTNIQYYPIELKCFRLGTQKGTGRRGAQNLGMYDYWDDIESLEQYLDLMNYKLGFQFTLTDDKYYVTTQHKGEQVKTYSTYIERKNVTGRLWHKIANRKGEIILKNIYDNSKWKKINNYYFICQKVF